MAVVRFGPLVQSVRGALGSVVFARQGGTAIVRPRPLKVNQRSARQLKQRALYARVVGIWRSLSDVDRLAWFRCAQTYRHRVGDGVSRPLSAWQVFALVVMRELNAGPYYWTTPNPVSGLVENVFVRVDAWPGGPVNLVHGSPAVAVGIVYDLFVQRTFRTVPTLPGRCMIQVFHAPCLQYSEDITAAVAALTGLPTVGEFVRWRCLSHMYQWPTSTSFAGLSQVPSVSAELVTNGNMEIPAGAGAPTGWFIAAAGTLTGAVAGQWGDLKSAKWARAGGAGGSAIYTDTNISCAVPGTYNLRFAAKCVSGTAWTYIFVAPVLGAALYITFTAPPADGLWHEYTFPFDIPAGQGNVKLQFDNTNATNMEVWLDNVSIRRNL